MHTPLPLPHRPKSADERGLPPIPWGWFIVCLSADLGPGEVKPLRYFGREMVLFRTESGRPVMFDAHCPHLGADLGLGGKVVGESIQCPFHAWKFGADGGCVEVPECERVPPKARANVWHTRERNGVIIAWFHPKGIAPNHEIVPLEDEGWTEPKSVVWRVRTHPQEVCENTVDTAHMRPVHSTETSRVLTGPTFNGPEMNVVLSFVASGEIVGMDGDNDVELDILMYGLGHIQVRSSILNAGLLARYRVCCTPIDREYTDIYGLVNVKYGDDPDFTHEVADIFYQAFTSDFVKDFPIWENKLYHQRPMLSAADGPIGAYRRWARQFYCEPSTAAKPVESGQTKPRGRVSQALLSAKGLLSRVRAVVPRRQGAQPPSQSNGANRQNGMHGATSHQQNGHTSKPRVKPASANGPSMRVDSVAHYRETLATRFVPSAAKGVDAVFQWQLSGDGATTFHAIVTDGAIEIVDGEHAAPTVTLSMTADDYVKVVNGELDGTKAFTSGRGKVSGKIRMAMKMRRIFPQ